VCNAITFIKGSITDLDTFQKAMQHADFVLHLAARNSVPKSVKHPLETNKINVNGTLNVLVAARDNKVKRVVFAASSSAYGETPTLPKTETMQPAPISPYGVSKYVGELYAEAFGPLLWSGERFAALFSIFSARARTPTRRIRECFRALPRRFWRKPNLSCIEMVNRRVILPTLKTQFAPISWRVKRLMFQEECLTSARASGLRSIGHWSYCGRFRAKTSQRNTNQHAKAISAIRRPTYTVLANVFVMNRR